MLFLWLLQDILQCHVKCKFLEKEIHNKPSIYGQDLISEFRTTSESILSYQGNHRVICTSTAPGQLGSRLWEKGHRSSWNSLWLPRLIDAENESIIEIK